jgi:hypothetical protein
VTAKSYRIPSERAIELADTIDAMSDELKAEYPEMSGLSLWLRRDAGIYPTVMVAFKDEDCVPYPDAPDFCAAGKAMTEGDIHGRIIVPDGYGS